MSYARFNPDQSPLPAVALEIEMRGTSVVIPSHHHRKAQLVLARCGTITCETLNSYWIVPPGSAVWIPSLTQHCTRISVNGRACMLFLKPDAVRMPGKCCLLAVSPLLRELLSRLATYPATQPPPPHVYLPLVSLLLSEMEAMPSQNFYLPLSPESRLRRIAEMLTNNPGDRATMKEWARRAATSERTLARLVKQEIGMTFGRWRTQMHIVVALQRLSEGAKVQTVANDLGYESLSSFTIMFKKHLGKSPVKFVHNFIDIDAAEPSLSKSIPLSQADPK